MISAPATPNANEVRFQAETQLLGCVVPFLTLSPCSLSLSDHRLLHFLWLLLRAAVAQLLRTLPSALAAASDRDVLRVAATAVSSLFPSLGYVRWAGQHPCRRVGVARGWEVGTVRAYASRNMFVPPLLTSILQPTSCVHRDAGVAAIAGCAESC